MQKKKNDLLTYVYCHHYLHTFLLRHITANYQTVVLNLILLD